MIDGLLHTRRGRLHLQRCAAFQRTETTKNQNILKLLVNLWPVVELKEQGGAIVHRIFSVAKKHIQANDGYS